MFPVAESARGQFRSWHLSSSQQKLFKAKSSTSTNTTLNHSSGCLLGSVFAMTVVTSRTRALADCSMKKSDFLFRVQPHVRIDPQY